MRGPSMLLHFREASVRLLGHIGCLGAQGALASGFASVLFSLSLEDIFCNGGSKGISVRSPVWRTLPIEIMALHMSMLQCDLCPHFREASVRLHSNIGRLAAQGALAEPLFP